MEKYEKYKDSGIEWIGVIPEHWDQGKLKNFCSLKGRIGWNGLRSDEFQQLSYAYLVTGQDFTSDSIDWSQCYQIDQARYEEDPFIQLANGDILITKDGTIGKIATVKNLDKPACLNSGIFVMKQTRGVFSQDYLYWLLVSDLLKEFNKYTSSGTTILHLYQNVFERMPVVVPPIDEQEKMAFFLSSECSKIDSLIATQQKRVELLKELRQSVITKAVTKGLDPNVKMKDSGVEWIGEVPEHWRVLKIRRVLDASKDGIKIGPFGSSLTGKVGDQNLPVKVYGQWNIVGHDFMAGSSFVSEETFEELKSYEVISNDILISMMGTVGKCAVIPEGIQTGIMDSHVVKVRLDQTQVRSDYFEYIYDKDNSAVVINNIQKCKKGSIMDGLNSSIIKDFFICLPPIEEQHDIVSFLNIECQKIDTLIETELMRISLLREYKQSLITEVVTGKRKVC